MKVFGDNIVLSDVFNGISFETSEGEVMTIYMRDTGFEFVYGGKNYEAKKGIISRLELDADSKQEASNE